MNILHYTIGLPPYRHGGSAKYVASLASEQNSRIDTNVVVLIPGDTLRFGNKSHIIKSNIRFGLIPVYEIVNPMISPLLFGIKNPDYILKHKKKFIPDELEAFYEKVKPDIMHIHTLMGLPEQLLQFFKNKNVKIIFTSHDYYGICPKVNLMDFNGENCSYPSGERCVLCNIGSPNYIKLLICNSNIFVKYKHLLPFNHKSISDESETKVDSYIDNNIKNKYEKLKEYYKKIFSYIDAFHFNSSLTKDVFMQSDIAIKHFDTILITTKDIKDNRSVKGFVGNLKIGYVGGIRKNKGFPILVKALKELYNNGITQWKLDVWDFGLNGIYKGCPNIEFRGGFNPSQLSDVYSNMHVLIVPSLCKETFSLITLEALSFGTPVIVSSNVGAKDIIKKYDPEFVFSSPNELKQLLRLLIQNRDKLAAYNLKIVNSEWEYSIDLHTNEIEKFYLKILNQ